MKQRICASLIVKNEEPVILRCLKSIAPIVDYILVVDTGSTDRTRELVSDFFSRTPGTLAERAWKDFAHNRTEALELARPFGDYTIIIDADDVLEIDPNFTLPKLEADGYFISIRDVAMSYSRLQIVNNRLPWRYRGVLHEFLETGGPNSTSMLHGLVIRRNHDGARRKNSETYLRDAEILERALVTETDAFLQARYRFYLAQSYRDSQDYQPAMTNYLKRAEVGYWIEEVFVSLLQAARCMERIGRPYEEVISTYERANEAVRTRAEALHGQSRYARHSRKFVEGFHYAKKGLQIVKPQGGLFIEDWIYKYGMLDELAINAYWAGEYEVCKESCRSMLLQADLPPDMVLRVRSNLAFAEQKLAERSNKSPHDDFSLELSEIKHDSNTSENIDGIIDRFWLLTRTFTSKYETYYWAARYCRLKNRFKQGSEFADKGICAIGDQPSDHRDWIAEYGMLDELAVNNYWAGNYKESFHASDELIIRRRLPDADFNRVYANREFARTKIGALLYPNEVIAEDRPLESTWTPGRALAGTELVLNGLKDRFPEIEQNIQLHVNMLPETFDTEHPLVLWMHHDVDQLAVQWCHQKNSCEKVARFVFVSNWQRERYIQHYGLDPLKCCVIRNATSVDTRRRIWSVQGTRKVAYTSTPFRGLDLLLNAWERLRLSDTELHVWSSMKLYNHDDTRYENVINRCRKTSGVVYRGIVPNEQLKIELRECHYLAYPCVFPETSCLAAIDAMAAGCRIVVPYLGALPETTAGFAHVYRWSADAAAHVRNFERALYSEMENPWFGNTAMALAQQNYCEMMYSWEEQIAQWKTLISDLI